MTGVISMLTDCDWDYFLDTAVCSMWSNSSDDDLNWIRLEGFVDQRE